MYNRFSLTRTREKAFHPQGDQHVIMASPDVFTVLRTSPGGDERILTMTNVTPRQTRVEIRLSEPGVRRTHWFDLINENEWVAENNKLKVTLEPYGVVWLKALPKSRG